MFFDTLADAILAAWYTPSWQWVNWYLYFVVFMFGVYTLLYVVSLPSTIKRYQERVSEDVYGILTSDSLPPITFIVPAFNERKNIITTINTLLNLSYRYKQIIISNDGSTDGTLELLIQNYSLVRIPPSCRGKIPTKPIRGYYVSDRFPDLLVIDKENGKKGDALNAALNACTSPVFVSLDADSLLDDRGLIHLVRPFLEQQETLVVHSNVCIANGCEIEDNRIVSTGFPKKWLTGFQVIEYLRTSFIDKMSFNNMTRGAMIVPGAFGMFKTDAVWEINGYDPISIVEDMEMTVRMHKFNLEQNRNYRITFIPENISWTEAPDDLSALNKQRRRWYGGTTDCMWQYRFMFFNRKYKSIGMIVFPYYTFDKLGPPTIEASGYIIFLIGFLLGKLDLTLFVILALACWTYASFLTCMCILAQETTFRLYPTVKDTLRMIWLAIMENVTYHYVLLWWKLRGLWVTKEVHIRWQGTPRKGYEAIGRSDHD